MSQRLCHPSLLFCFAQLGRSAVLRHIKFGQIRLFDTVNGVPIILLSINHLPLSAVFFDCSLADKPGPYCGKVTKCDPSRNSHTWVCVGFYILCHCLLGLCLGLETSFLLVGLYKSHVKSILICEAKNSGLSVTSEVGSAFPIMRVWRKNEWGFCCCPSFLVEGLELIPGELSVLHNVLFLMISYFEDVSKRRIHSEYLVYLQPLSDN